VDDLPVWSIPCFFVDRRYRKQGLTTWLIREAARYAFSQGAPAVEAYPVHYEGGRASDTFYYTGKISAFEKAGFKEVARPSKTKSIMRLYA
jgi:GNAT superfamily N-acetyltransferase